MGELVAISVTKRDYRSRTIQRGKSIPLMMETALRRASRAIVQDVKAQLPSRRMKVNTFADIHQTPKGASATIVVGRGVPFTNVMAKWGSDPTVIRPKGGKKNLAIPLNSFARGLQNKVSSLMEYGKTLHPRWYGHGQRGNVLYYGNGKVPMFALRPSVSVPPKVNLHTVSSQMRDAANIEIAREFEGYDFGFVSLRKGSR